MLAALSFEFRLALLFVIGAVTASFLNLATYRLAWHQRSISPWSKAPPGAAPRTWLDCVPIFGWLPLRREAAIHGPGFWIRPLLVELVAGIGLAALYWWEVDQAALLPPAGSPLLASLTFPVAVTLEVLTAGFISHALLLALMLVATLIDFDEKTIPDGITVPGTLIGLALATVWPWSLLPGGTVDVASKGRVLEPLHVATPNAWPLDWLAAGSGPSLAIALGCYALWCFWLLPRVWYGRYGFARATRYFLATIVRNLGTRIVLGMWLIGSAAIVAARFAGDARWAGLMTSLVGLVVAGGIVWTVRLIGQWVLRREAMGFGDVTLMAMIGTFLGWQPAILVFFLAPMVGLVFGVVNLLIKSESEIPYGPFLCGAALTILVYWSPIWQEASRYFSMGLWIPAVLGVCLLAMIVLLQALQLVKAIFDRR
ncbi:MAG: hypothetical protein DWQ31_16260 [Planctomycetota bacterium]|nr:MAG: hypothetical protein DWQ31_16260 [Planctomycetota bacterium]REJ87601.1 MAG: hypothetical protein DWQ35_21035 [Planctomycetota bacterium]